MLTAQKTAAFTHELKPLLQKYTNAEGSDEERIIANAVVDNVLDKFAYVGFESCKRDAALLHLEPEELVTRVNSIFARGQEQFTQQCRAQEFDQMIGAAMMQIFGMDFGTTEHLIEVQSIVPAMILDYPGNLTKKF